MDLHPLRKQIRRRFIMRLGRQRENATSSSDDRCLIGGKLPDHRVSIWHIDWV